MKLPNTSRLIKKGIFLSSIASLSMVLASCDSMIYDDQGDCSVHYRVSFRYTKNILNTDAFGSQVTQINVAIYDKNGKMVLHKTEERSLTPDNNYYMDVDILPGTYDILAWCEGKSAIPDATSFLLSGQSLQSTMTESGAQLTLSAGNGGQYSDKDINRLYYGFSRNVEFIDSYGVVNVEPVYLTKDTNHIIITLQNVDDSEIDPDNISFELSGQNSQLDWQNNLVGDEKFTYYPWSKKSISSTVEELSVRSDNDIPNGVIAELTTGRIMADVDQTLTIKRVDTGETIFSIPLVEYLLLVRSNYEQATSNQDYLDRYDDFTMVFFMQDGYNWVKSRILINGWRVVPPQNGSL